MERVGEISQIVVQETASCGFFYTMLGLGLVGMACLAVFGIALIMTDKGGGGEEVVIGWLIAAICIFTITGLLIAMFNLCAWIAPTRQVVREVFDAIQ